MAAICGLRATGTGGTAVLDAMLRLLPGQGATRSAWPQVGLGLGCREGPIGGSVLCAEPTAGLALAADARLDDRDGLCASLAIPVAERRRLGDEQLILRAWLRWGEDCPRQLLGDYAFALWDARRRLLFCARDHAGARPFYYALPKDGFVFASAVEAVLAAPDVGDALDEGAVATYLASPHCSDARTFFAAVRKLPPGHGLCVEWTSAANGATRRQTRLARHWRPEQVPAARPAADDEYAEQFRDLLTQAVRDRLRGCEANAVGTHLSGGLDSSSIAVVAARELRRQGRSPPLAFSWLPRPATPPKPEHAPEYALIDAVCAQERIEVIHGAPSAEDVLDVLLADGALPGIHVHLNEEVAQRHAATRGVRVLLSGWGGDECISFSGRGHWQRLLLRGRWRQLAAEWRAQDASALRFLAHVTLPLLHPALVPSLAGWHRGRPIRRRSLIDAAFARRAKPLGVREKRAIGVRETQLRLLRTGHLAERIEGWAASGGARGIEYRYPLLDRRLLEFALALPPEQFRRGRWGRWLFRHGCRTLLPPEVCWNRTKADPARSEPFLDAFVDAFPAIRQRFAERAPARARYVAVERLLERLDAARFRAQPEPGPMMKALQFLDF